MFNSSPLVKRLRSSSVNSTGQMDCRGVSASNTLERKRASSSVSTLSTTTGENPTGLKYPTLYPSLLNFKPNPRQIRFFPEKGETEAINMGIMVISSLCDSYTCVQRHRTTPFGKYDQWIYIHFYNFRKICHELGKP